MDFVIAKFMVEYSVVIQLYVFNMQFLLLLALLNMSHFLDNSTILFPITFITVIIINSKYFMGFTCFKLMFYKQILYWIVPLVLDLQISHFCSFILSWAGLLSVVHFHSQVKFDFIGVQASNSNLDVVRFTILLVP